ncbi:MAG: stage V sporulation protein AD [Turicibacter sp.]|nr:stage V sporulation protein AD [Turicibacter sp.]
MKIGKQSWRFENKVYIQETATSVGPLEAKGPLGKFFDVRYDEPYMGQKTWEQAEIQLIRGTLQTLFNKSGLHEKDICLALCGDLVNQLVPSHYAFREFNLPFLGMYGACATGIQSLLLSAVLVDSFQANHVIAGASSHTMTVERQFRNPVEYGGPKPETAQNTIMGAGLALVSRKPSPVRIESATAGIIVDAGQKNPNDMGSAMAPAAAQSLMQHLDDLGLNEDYYDMIVTGDLAKCGTPVFINILKQKGIEVEDIHSDCGNLIYSDKQKVFSGGSGAGCCPVVTFGYLCDLLKHQKVKRVLVLATGALLNPLIMQQKESIPCIAHAVALVSEAE